MRILTSLLLMITTIISCGKKGNGDTDVVMVENMESSDLKVYPAYNWDTLRGIYSGPFSDKEININLTYVSEFNVVGYSVVSGLIRNLSGKVTQNDDSVRLVLEEPGDHVHDGKFYLNIHKTNFGVSGRWAPFRASISPKNFKLKKKIFDFNVDTDYEKAPVTETSFIILFGDCRDSLGRYEFLMDGSVVYEFYNTPSEFEENNNTAMQKSIGSWEFKKGNITIYWQPNFAFPNLKSQFKLIYDDEQLILKGEGRIIYPLYGAA